jgi:glycosyltransferase involved in cell wall biosynthesis
MNLSVLMSVYAKECPKHFYMALQSIAAQTLRPAEVILVEDGPISDELRSVIEQFKDELKIRSIKIEENRGLALALNEG